ncbi:hypothetical protein GXW74_24885 [Roseomonas eburnea]|uniref:Uncharacterized protein n=1 Tax=Neoroseomonas eburnea TaxID=1346889 RepID=A0A9X9XJ50_9PROT|nr:hypothetical protein [Neoroseomonas eburnea]MBR0683736.1 hypothetical protein [Neoroseomonas eburnea]
MTGSIWKRLVAVAVLLLLPFVVFVGESSRAVVNGRVVSQYQVNYLGVVLALVGLGLALAMVIRRSLSQRLDAPATPAWARALAAVLALLCLGQAAMQAGLVQGW